MKKWKKIGKKFLTVMKKRIWGSFLKVWHVLLLGVLITYGNCLPSQLFQDPTSTVILDQEGLLLGARIARDDQWRFPPLKGIPEKFKHAICTFEDKRFDYHPGLDPMAILRALCLNIIHGEIRSGGSTLTMQVIRLSRKGKARTIFEKIIEMILATRLEIRHSKKEILNLYASYAPFGGNVVGLETAAWKYYGREAEDLSWSETCTLAVLPNAPGLIYPGRNRSDLLRKRNFLLKQLLEDRIIDSTTWELALLEELPAKPLPLPRFAPHLLEKIHQERLRKSKVHAIQTTTIQRDFQVRANEIVRRHHKHLKASGINNIAALVVEVESGDIVAYVGNAPCTEEPAGCEVNIIDAARSTGSILKPFLFAEMLDAGEILPSSLVPDVPSYFGGFSPTNFNRNYQGAIPAKKALARSLNVPIVHMLKTHGINRFQSELKSLGMSTLYRPAEAYGLTLVLGGAEATLFDLASIYSGMARTLKLSSYYGGKYAPNAFRPLNYLVSESQQRLAVEDFNQLGEDSHLLASSISSTFDALVEVSRPQNDNFWEQFSSSQKIAWKTGTSYGYRDAWSIGCTPNYVVAVWVGNADGEGRPGIIGAISAAPIMFDLFDAMPSEEAWFSQPVNEMSFVPLCKESGQRPGIYCPETDTTWIPKSGLLSEACAYHKIIKLDRSEQFRVHSSCENPLNMKQNPYFILPPSQALYYRRNHPDYKSLPPYRVDCSATIYTNSSEQPIQLIYPSPKAALLIPVDLDGTLGRTVFEAVHRDTKAILYWHLDDKYIGRTIENHQLSVNPSVGKHTLTLVDDQGFSVSRKFEIIMDES